MRVTLINQSEELYSVESATGQGCYRVNLKEETCGCPHFANRLAAFEPGDPRRACKHQQAARDQRPFIIAANKAERLSNALLAHLLQKYGNDVLLGGVLRSERDRRRKLAQADAANRAIFA